MTNTKKLILVVDDEPDIRSLLSDELNYHGFSCIEADSGNNALNIIHQNPGNIQAIITDIRMSNGGGDALLRTLKSLYHSDIPIFLTTGFSDLTTREALHLGAAGIIHKPFRYTTLLTQLKKAIGPLNERWDCIDEELVTVSLTTEIFLNSRFDWAPITDQIGTNGAFFITPSISLAPRLEEKIGFKIKINGPNWHNASITGVGTVQWSQLLDTESRFAGCGLKFEELTETSYPVLKKIFNEFKVTATIPDGNDCQKSFAYANNATRHQMDL